MSNAAGQRGLRVSLASSTIDLRDLEPSTYYTWKRVIHASGPPAIPLFVPPVTRNARQVLDELLRPRRAPPSPLLRLHSPATMYRVHRRALGALLAASIASPFSAFSDVQPPPAAQPPNQRNIHPLLASAESIPDSSPLTSNHISSPAEISRARALLDRYYAISAEAVASNAKPSSSSPPLSQSATPPPPPPFSAKAPRAPATHVFSDLDPSSISGPICKRYVICGGGTAAWAAVEALLQSNSAAASDILVVSDESFRPYNRTMLSKELWEKDAPNPAETPDAVEYAYRAPAITTGRPPVDVLRGARVARLDVEEKSVVVDSAGHSLNISYDKLLLATGGTPRPASRVSLALAQPTLASSVWTFRTLADFSALRARLAEKPDAGAVVIGGGFLGAELALAMSEVAQNVSLVVAEAGVLYRVLPRYLCEFLARKIDEAGVKVMTSAVVTGAERTEEGRVALAVASPDGGVVEGGEVVVAIGIDPDVELAKDAGLEVDAVNGGVIVNDFMMAEPDVFAAGDVASFHDRALGRRRVEHWDHAVVTGRIAAQNMMGKRERYGLQSMFWSDLRKIGVQITAVGLVDSRLETVGVWNTAMPSMEEAPSTNELVSGVVYYVKDWEIVGVVMCNARKGSGALRRARALVDAKINVKGMSQEVLGNLVNVDDGSFRMTVHTKGL